MVTLTEVRALIEQGKLEAARDALVDFLYEDYDNLEAWLLLTECPEDEQEYARAIREALRIAPDDPHARRLAVDLGRDRGTYRNSGETVARRRTSRVMRWFANWTMLVVIAVAGASIAVLLILSADNDDSPSNMDNAIATAGPQAVCQHTLDTIYARLPARCGLVPEAEICLGNPSVSFDVVPGFSAPLLPGDRMLVEHLVSVDVARYTPIEEQWGVVVGQGGLEGQIGFATTGGARLSRIDANLSALTLNTNPVLVDCAAVPPHGLLLYANTERDTFTLNGLDLAIDGVGFVQIDAAGGLRVVVFTGTVVAQLEGVNTLESVPINAGQWTTVSVDAMLQVNDVPIPANVGDAPVRGDILNLVPLADALGLETSDWKLPGGPVAVAVQPTPTATRGIRISTVTPSPSPTRTPRQTSTPRPTRTPTETLVPTSTAIPVLDATATRPVVSITAPPPTALLRPVISGTWACLAVIDDQQFSYEITIEPLLVRNQVLGSVRLSQFGNTIITLRGEEVASIDDLDANWTRLPGYLEAETWMMLAEDSVLYAPPGGGYDAGGVLRVFYTGEAIRGGIFDGERLVGTLIECQPRE